MGADPGAASAARRARGIAAYARIFGVPDEQVAAVFASRVGPVFAEEALQAAGRAPAAHRRPCPARPAPRLHPRRDALAVDLTSSSQSRITVMARPWLPIQRAITGALRSRGVGELAATVAAELASLTFSRTVAAWSEPGNTEDFGVIAHRVLRSLHAAAELK